MLTIDEHGQTRPATLADILPMIPTCSSCSHFDLQSIHDPMQFGHCRNPITGTDATYGNNFCQSHSDIEALE